MANKYFRKYLVPAPASETTLYTVPAANSALISSLRVTNNNASNTALTVKIYPQGGLTGYFVLKNYVLPVSNTMDVFSGISCVMEATDVIKVISSMADVNFYLSYLEVDRN
jgi:hypothetical protein